MDQQRAHPGAGLRPAPGGRRPVHGPPWRGRPAGGGPSGGPGTRGDRLPWLSTVVVGVIVMGGTTVAAHGQGREPLGLVARLPLLAAVAVLLVRHRHPVVAVAGTSAATLVHLALGYPYGPVLLAVAVGCFSAIVSGTARRRGGRWADSGRGICRPRTGCSDGCRRTATARPPGARKRS
ncbi:hypothetical protein [Streptomyces sp. NPDC060322]|uniref:hypothetical protein n=1 Tax=Streptomyces sp. NPDC060322 TaxID=3347097 RepID=UPI00364B1448